MVLAVPRRLVRLFVACLLGGATGLAAGAEPVFVLPAFAESLGARTRDGLYIEDLDVFRTPVATLAQEQKAFAIAQAGLTLALDEANPGAAIDYLAAYLAVRWSAEELAKQTPGSSLPERDRFRTLLERRAAEAWREGRPGTALLAWTLWDRAGRLPHERIEQVERSVDANGGWVVWRRRVLAELSRILPPVTGFSTQGWTLPRWSPLLQHPTRVLGNDPIPIVEVDEIRSLGAPLREAFRASADVGAALRIKVALPQVIAAPEHTESYEQAWVPFQSEAFSAFERAQKEKLAELDRRIAAAQARADREAPKVTKQETIRKLVGYEDRPTYDRALPFGTTPPGARQGERVRQGEIYRSGTVRVPVYEETTITREVVDPKHPLYIGVQALRQERLSVVQKEFPVGLRNSFIIDSRRMDRWVGTADVPLEIDDGSGATRLTLRVPFIRNEARGRDVKAPDLVGGKRAWRAMAQDPAGDGAADVHRAVALWWNFRRLESRLGAELAAREVALVGELGFGLQLDTGPVVSRLRDMFQSDSYSWTTSYQEQWRTGSGLPARADPGAPPMVYEWPGSTEKAVPLPPPAGEFRLVHDPAVEREASALAERLRAARLSLRTEVRALPRTAPRFPVLALARSRSADLGGFLWQSVPEQMPALHDDTGAERELRLHAPTDEQRFTEGMAWICAHPSRFSEARRLARRLLALGGPQTVVQISVSVRGIVREGRPEKTVLAPDPESRWLREFLQSAGLSDYLPTQALRLGPRRSASADLVVVLRGLPDAPARGLSSGALKTIEGKPDTLLLVTNGTGRIINATAVPASTLALW